MVMATRSEKTALEFYERLGPAGIVELTTPESDAETVSQLGTRLPPASRVLDLGCGYGRIALPLVRRGYRIVALDLCQNLLVQGRHDAHEASLPISWLRGTMRSIPIVAGSFDAVLCLWTAFFELVDPLEQLSTLSEVLRVLRPGGWALFEGPPYREPTSEEIASGQRCGPGHRVLHFRVADAENWLYCHDESSLRHVSLAAGVDQPSVHIQPWGGRERLLLEFSKPTLQAAA
jgi:ubiquinone/menaquinone biosynthesis C-methylase UbiE